MTFPKARLVVSACLFLTWLGFLFYLVINSRTIILSKPQFLIAQLYVVVEASAGVPGDLHPDATVTIAEVLWSAHDADHKLETQVLRIPDLAECTKEHGYLGKGKYLLPLLKSSDGWLIAPLPRRAHVGEKELRIYRWTTDTQAQVNELIAARKR